MSRLARKLLLIKALSVAGGGALSFLLRDDFLTDESAPLASPRDAEPGPGTLTLVQTDGEFSISGEALSFPAQSTPAWGDLSLVAGEQTRQTGRVFVALLSLDRLKKFGWLGWNNDATPTDANQAGINCFRWNNTTATYLWYLEAVLVNAGAISLSTNYHIAIIMRSSGVFCMIKGGTEFVDWTLSYVSATGSASGYPALSNYNGTGTIDTLRVADLPAPWNTDYGIATDRHAGSVSAGTTFTHEGDMLGEFEATTLPSADQIEWRFRVQDATNYWQVTVNSAGDLELDEVVAGSVTQRGTSAAVVVNGDRIVVIADGTTIRVYEANTLRITYSSASNFQNETDGELETLGTGGAVSDLVLWPRTLSGTAANLLDQAVS